MRYWLPFLLFLVPSAVQSAAVMQGVHPWQHGEVPYRIAPELLKRAGASGTDCTGWQKWRSSEATKACQAMEQWHAVTGIRFVPNGGRLDSVDIIPGDGTDGTLGHWPIGNHVHIEPHASFGAVLHEFGHVLGLMHEQQRPDRDQYLTLSPFLQKDLKFCTTSLNVCTDVMANFPVIKTQMQTDYDPCSLMHYLADQTPRHREDSRWSRIYTLTAKGQAALAKCSTQFSAARCRKPGQKCAISHDDAALVRRFNGV